MANESVKNSFFLTVWSVNLLKYGHYVRLFSYLCTYILMYITKKYV